VLHVFKRTNSENHHPYLHNTGMSSRKRRRDQAFADEDIEVGAVATEVETISSEKQRAEKEQEVWDAIREAHFEGQRLSLWVQVADC
jgi:hypothetical protein